MTHSQTVSATITGHAIPTPLARPHGRQGTAPTAQRSRAAREEAPTQAIIGHTGQTSPLDSFFLTHDWALVFAFNLKPSYANNAKFRSVSGFWDDIILTNCHGFGNADQNSGILDAYDVFFHKEGTQVRNGIHLWCSSYHNRCISCQQNQYHDIYLLLPWLDILNLVSCFCIK